MSERIEQTPEDMGPDADWQSPEYRASRMMWENDDQIRITRDPNVDPPPEDE